MAGSGINCDLDTFSQQGSQGCQWDPNFIVGNIDTAQKQVLSSNASPPGKTDTKYNRKKIQTGRLHLGMEESSHETISSSL